MFFQILATVCFTILFSVAMYYTYKFFKTLIEQ